MEVPEKEVGFGVILRKQKLKLVEKVDVLLKLIIILVVTQFTPTVKRTNLKPNLFEQMLWLKCNVEYLGVMFPHNENQNLRSFNL